MSRGCKVPGCPKPAKARGWCAAHHQRWFRYGSPLVNKAPRYTPEEDAIILAAKPTPECDRRGAASGSTPIGRAARQLGRTELSVRCRRSHLRRKAAQAAPSR